MGIGNFCGGAAQPARQKKSAEIMSLRARLELAIATRVVVLVREARPLGDYLPRPGRLGVDALARLRDRYALLGLADARHSHAGQVAAAVMAQVQDRVIPGDFNREPSAVMTTHALLKFCGIWNS